MKLLKGGIVLAAAAAAALFAWQLPSTALAAPGRPSAVADRGTSLTEASAPPSPSLSASPSPSPSPSLPSPAPTGFASCAVTYDLLSGAYGSFKALITIANTGQGNITPWELTWTFPGDQQITGMQNAVYSQSGQNVAAANVSYDAEISVNSAIGFTVSGTYTDSDAAPASFQLNGNTCT
jgi:hypothetical protein